MADGSRLCKTLPEQKARSHRLSSVAAVEATFAVINLEGSSYLQER